MSGVVVGVVGGSAGGGGATAGGAVGELAVEADTGLDVDGALVSEAVGDCHGRQSSSVTASSTTIAATDPATSHRCRGPGVDAAVVAGLGAGLAVALGADAVGADAAWASADVAAFNARAKSAQHAYRSAGSLASARASTGSSAASAGRFAVNEGGSAFRWRLITTAGLDCGNSCSPVRRWSAVAANPYWSARPSTSSPINCSGAA